MSLFRCFFLLIDAFVLGIVESSKYVFLLCTIQCTFVATWGFGPWLLNLFLFNLWMIFWCKWPPNFEESFASCNFFVWFWQKDLKLGGYELNLSTNSSLAAGQFFSDIWMVVAPQNSRTRDIRFSGLKYSGIY